MPRIPKSITILFVTAAMFASTVSFATADEPIVFISAFAPGDQGAIHAFQLDAAAGALKPIHRTTGVEHPFFLAVSRDQKFLYSIHAKSFGGKDAEEVAAFAIDGRSGRLRFLNRQSTRGSASCYLDVDATGKAVLVANYSTGNVASLPVNADGSLGEAASFHQHSGSSVDPVRQKGPYAHSIVVSPDNRFAFAADLGLDQILSYRLDAKSAKLSPNDPPFAKSPPGAGPRHLTFHPSGKHLYSINELKNSVTMFDYAAQSGSLTPGQTISTLPADFTGTSYCADLKITPDGRFLYGTNRGHDSIAAYAIGDDGRLTLIGIEPSLGKGPQNLAIGANGTLLLCANMSGNNVAVFRIDAKTGGLKSVGQPISMPSPSCIQVLQSAGTERADSQELVRSVVAPAGTGASTTSLAAQTKGDADWVRVTESDDRIKIETDKLEAAIPKNKKASKQWMTGIEKHSFVDRATGFHEIGDGLMVIDWIMEPGSDEAYRDKLHATEENGLGSYLWHTNETDPGRIAYSLNAHGGSHRKRPIEGPQLCPWMKPVQPELIRGKDFVAVKTTYKYEYAAPGRKAGSRWTQLVVFPKGVRYFVLMDKIDSVNDSDEMFLRNDTPGCVRHNMGDTFSEMYLSYLGPKGVRIPSSEFFTPFPPDLKFGYRRDTHRTPQNFIRAYHLRDPQTGKDGPWLAGLTLEPSVVYEAWASQRLGNNIIVMIEEIHGRPVKAGESFSAAHIVGFFDTIDEMHAVYDKHKGHTALSVDATGWKLVK